MSGEGSTPGGVLVCQYREFGKAYPIEVGHNDVFLECLNERKGTIPTQQKFEGDVLVVSNLPVLIYRGKIQDTVPC